jgi:hypothetical protein
VYIHANIYTEDIVNVKQYSFSVQSIQLQVNHPIPTNN